MYKCTYICVYISIQADNNNKITTKRNIEITAMKYFEKSQHISYKILINSNKLTIFIFQLISKKVIGVLKVKYIDFKLIHTF